LYHWLSAAVFSGSSFGFDDVEVRSVEVNQVGCVSTSIRDDDIPGFVVVELGDEVCDVVSARRPQDL
jgi:hypothetical protein